MARLSSAERRQQQEAARQQQFEIERARLLATWQPRLVTFMARAAALGVSFTPNSDESPTHLSVDGEDFKLPLFPTVESVTNDNYWQLEYTMRNVEGKLEMVLEDRRAMARRRELIRGARAKLTAEELEAMDEERRGEESL